MPVSVKLTDGSQATVCISTIRQNDVGAGKGEFDWLLGDVFLRNVYSMYDFGDLDTSTGGLVGHPFIKLLALPTSIYDAALKEFRTARTRTLALLPPTIDPSLVSAGAPSDPSSSSGGGKAASAAGGGGGFQLNVDSGSGTVDAGTLTELHDNVAKVVKYMPYVLGLLGGGVLVLLILLVISCVGLRRGKTRARTYQPITH